MFLLSIVFFFIATPIFDGFISFLFLSNFHASYSLLLLFTANSLNVSVPPDVRSTRKSKVNECVYA